jgi:arabinose-5-phosphate isomerase
VQGVASSNPAVPTSNNRAPGESPGAFFLWIFRFQPQEVDEGKAGILAASHDALLRLDQARPPMSQPQNSSAKDARAIAMGRQVLDIEADAVSALGRRLDDRFAAAVRLILDSPGRVIVSGIGKSGHVGRKIAATLASTGTPAYFVHAAEAVHGDLGMIARDDVLIALSNSGENDELLTIMPLVKRQGGKLIAITGNETSSLAQEADIHLDARVDQEACSLNLAPTASTTAALALGDALAVALLDARGFDAEDFARSHPGGVLGRKLLTHVSDVMKVDVPAIAQTSTVPVALTAMTRGSLGMVAVLDGAGKVVGIFTDGDLRRAMEQRGDLRSVAVGDVMTRSPRTIHARRLAAEAVEMMESHKINQLLVVDDGGALCGALNMHDLFRAKVI